MQEVCAESGHEKLSIMPPKNIQKDKVLSLDPVTVRMARLVRSLLFSKRYYNSVLYLKASAGRLVRALSCSQISLNSVLYLNASTGRLVRSLLFIKRLY